MKHLFIVLGILLAGTTRAQTARQLHGLLGNGFNELHARKSYPYSSLDNRCTIVPSLTLYNDTSGVHLQNEYLLFRNAIHYRNGSERLKFISTGYVTVAEYKAFQRDVRDSIAREHIYRYDNEDDDALEWLRYGDKKILQRGQINREQLRQLYPLNHARKVAYDDWGYTVMLADLYLPFAERFNQLKQFDDRKLIYRYDEVYEKLIGLSGAQLERIDPALLERPPQNGRLERQVSLISDPYAWSRTSASRRDQGAVLGELYERLETNSPAIGLTGTQASAFCHWKQEQLQRECDQKGWRCTIIVTLPTIEDQQSLQVSDPAFAIPELDYTQQWRITVGEYKRFVAHARDSLLRETLFARLAEDRYAMRFLAYRNFHFDGTEIVGLDASDRLNNRFFFPLDYSTKINLRNNEVRTILDSLQQTRSYTQPYYTYEWMNAHDRGQTGTFKRRNARSNLLEPAALDDNGNWEGKELSLDWTGPMHYTSGVRSHEHIGRFYVNETIFVLPEPAFPLESQPNKALVKGISYDQALAFYHWKYPTWKAEADQDWQQFVLPTAEQFQRIQRGETILMPAQTVPYPTPLFRYVVHVY